MFATGFVQASFPTSAVPLTRSPVNFTTFPPGRQPETRPAPRVLLRTYAILGPRSRRAASGSVHKRRPLRNLRIPCHFKAVRGTAVITISGPYGNLPPHRADCHENEFRDNRFRYCPRCGWKVSRDDTRSRSGVSDLPKLDYATGLTGRSLSS